MNPSLPRVSCFVAPKSTTSSWKKCLRANRNVKRIRVIPSSAQNIPNKVTILLAVVVLKREVTLGRFVVFSFLWSTLPFICRPLAFPCLPCFHRVDLPVLNGQQKSHYGSPHGVLPLTQDDVRYNQTSWYFHYMSELA